MRVDPADSGSHQAVLLHERQDLVMICERRFGDVPEKREDFSPPPEIPAGQFSDDEGVTPYDAVGQEIREGPVPALKMIDPDRRVDEHQRAFRGRRRRTGRRVPSEPPRAASRLALSRAMSASIPARTSAVFSLIPVNCLAR